MYSFYGGRPGNSFVIITSFPTIAEMIEKFKKGPNYTDVHFDEHVIINTTNKNNPDNGKIFRRGYNYTDSQGGAIPVGQIVGPSGPAPSLILSDYDTVKNKKTEDPTIDPNKVDEKTGSYKISDSSLVPGYEYDESTETEIFNDEIKWISCSIRKSNDETCEAYIGFKIPYLIMDWEVESISANNAPTIQESEESEGHPFYKKWKLGIPRGKKGNSFSNLRIDTANNQIVYDQISYENNQDGVTEGKVLGQYNMIQNITKTNEGLSIKYYNNETPQNFSIKQITSIQLDDDYYLNVVYNDGTKQQIPFKCIKEINFDKDNGNLTFTYTYPPNSGSTQLTDTYSINWIKSAEIKTTSPTDDSQFLYLNWVNPIEENPNSYETRLSDFKWIKRLSLTSDGFLQVTYNNNDSEILNRENPIVWLKSIGIDEQGRLKCITNNSAENSENGTKYLISRENGLKWVTETSLSDTGILTFQYNNDTQQSLTGTPIKWIDSVSLSADGELTINYNTGDSQTINGTIHWINNISMNSQTGEITAIYNDIPSAPIGQVRFINNVEVDEDNHLMITYSDDLENSVDVGSVAANLTFIDEYAYNLNCGGLGSIAVITEENQGIEQTKKYINLTSPVTSLIGDRSIQVLSPEDGEEDTLNLTVFLKGSNQQISFGNNRPEISVGRMLTGLNFMIEIPSSENSNIYENLSNGDIVDVLITGLNLHFIEQ